MTQTHLYKVRNAKRLRTIGKTWAETAEGVGVSIPTARKMVDEYWERHKAGTLFEDLESREDDAWRIASVQRDRYGAQG